MIILVLTAKFSGVLSASPRSVVQDMDEQSDSLPPSRWDNRPAWQRK